MSKEDVDKLIDKYLAGECTPEERAIIEKAYFKLAAAEESTVDPSQLKRQRKRIWKRLQGDEKLWITRYARIAAAVLLCIGASAFFLSRIGEKPEGASLVSQTISPGQHVAMLTLADGRKVNLSKAQSGIIVGDGITYADGSNVLHGHAEKSKERFDNKSTSTESNEWKEPSANQESPSFTLETPKGGTYQITLSDGTKVWLNAESKLTYPEQFSDQERIVFLEGEAFFDVSKQFKKADRLQRVPFKVISKQQEVNVLGTQFNITAYPGEEEITTTLVEGAVNVGSRLATKRYRLMPQQQAKWSKQGYTVKKVNVKEFVDWVRGYFTFNQTPLKTAMTEIGRWYNIDIDYQGNLDNMYFGGSFSRSKNLQEVLNILSSTAAMKFKIEGRRVIVMPE